MPAKAAATTAPARTSRTTSRTSPADNNDQLVVRTVEPTNNGHASGTTKASATVSKKKSSTAKKKTGALKKATPMAARMDRHDLYQKAVQGVEAEIDFVEETFQTLRGRKPSLIREDFCGTANSSCEFVRRRRTNHAIGVDLDLPTLEWGRRHNIDSLPPAARERVRLVHDDVRRISSEPVDAVLAMNFSYYIFMDRATMIDYYRTVRQSLADGGLFIMDAYGGYESYKECKEKRKVNKDFTYIWEQARYSPITGIMDCFIHFHFSDGSKMNRAFSYTWRLWTLPEIREMLSEAGFTRSTVYWEGAEEDSDEGNGVFEPDEEGTADPSWVCYIVAEK